MGTIIWILWPVAAGAACHWFSGRCRGRNARDAFRLGGWGFWLLMLRFIPIGLFWPLNVLLLLIPSAICFLLAANSIAKEMRAQQTGEFTDPA